MKTPGSTTQPAPITHSLPQRIPEGMCRSLYVSPSATIVCPAFGPAVVAADEIRVAGEQVDDLALALVAPLRADDHGRGHAGSMPASAGR